MTHKREDIMQAVLTTVTGLGLTGANVVRGRVWPIPALPALTVKQGTDAVQTDDDQDAISRRLNFEITATIQKSNTLETDLNAIAEQVYKALMADRSLGLSFVYDLMLDDDGEPDLAAEQEKTTARLTMTFAALYDHSLNDAGVE